MIEKADAWIRKHLGIKCRVADLADYLGVSGRTLQRRFQEHTGHTPQLYIQKVKMEYAKAQLESTKDSIAAISYNFGFSDENAFRRAFIQTIGISPAQYRNQFSSRLPVNEGR